jgi:L-alanine-DL-glutamate epimerase-like enolase superfamily enzyme
MKIKHLHAWKQDLTLVRPYTIASRQVTAVENVFFEILLENGMTGIGSANPAPEVVGESPDEALMNLQSPEIQAFAGRDIRHFRQLIDEANSLFPHRPGTLAALDLALHDAFCKWLGIPVVEFYGQKIQSLLTSITIGIKGVAETLEEATEYRDRGFRVLKVKTGLNVEEDVERIAKLREAFGKHFTIRIDANLGYSLEELRYFFEKTALFDIELVEQPMAVGAENQLLTLPENLRRRLAADESLKDAPAALRLAASPQPFGIFNIKLMKCGGIAGALDIANIAKAAGIELFWGCNDESIVSITAALHAAFACPNTRYIDLDGSLDLAIDAVSGGFLLENGVMRPIGLPGLGVLKF